MNFTIENIDGGATRLFTLATDDTAVTLMLFERSLDGLAGVVAHHVQNDGAASCECNILGRCCVRDRQIMTSHPVNVMDDDAIRNFLETTLETGV